MNNTPTSVPNLDLSFPEIMEALAIAHKAKRTIHLQGAPGVGKSAAPCEYGILSGMPLVDIRPARMNPVDFTGLPYIVHDLNLSKWTKPEIILDVPAIYVVEEIATAAELMQVSLYELTGDRRIGKYAVHPDSLIVTTGNRPEDAAFVKKMSSALRGRFCAVTMRADHEAFAKFAAKKGLHPMVSGFVEYRNELLSKFDGKKWDGTSGYPSPRTWHIVSDLMWGGLADSPLLLNMVAGIVGYPAAVEFSGYVAVHHRIITPEMIVLDPHTCKVPDDGVEQWATASAIALAINPTNAAALTTYLQRMPAEFMAFALKSAVGRNNGLMKVDEVKRWFLKNASLFSGNK
jgi:hypothetical protein